MGVAKKLFISVLTAVTFAKPSLAGFGQTSNAPTTVVPAGIGQSVPLPTPPVAGTTLTDGTAIKLRLTETISSENAKVGQSVPFEVLEDFYIKQTLVIAKGAQATGTVTEAQPKRRMGRGGKLDVNIDSLRLVDGEKALLSATQNVNGGGHVGAMTAGMVGAAIVFFPAAPLLLFMHGKDITIPKGTPVTAFIQGDMKLDIARFAPTSGIPSTSLMLTIDSNLPNCDIEIDGSFAGNTPSTMKLAPGKHRVSVKKDGYSDWEREIILNEGEVRVSAKMLAK